MKSYHLSSNTCVVHHVWWVKLEIVVIHQSTLTWDGSDFWDGFTIASIHTICIEAMVLLFMGSYDARRISALMPGNLLAPSTDNHDHSGTSQIYWSLLRQSARW